MPPPPPPLQAMCFMAGANSIFDGDKLLTTPNNDRNEDLAMFEALGLRSRPAFLNYPSGNDSSRDFNSEASGDGCGGTGACGGSGHHHEHEHGHAHEGGCGGKGACGGKHAHAHA